MSGFIHGEVSLVDTPGVVVANVRRMLDVVAHYPWVLSSIKESVGRSSCCVMGVQLGPGASDSFRRSVREYSAFGIAADLRLHERSELAIDLGLSATEASVLGDELLALRAYSRWGAGFAGRLVGDGALALWDESTERLVCWRDAAGVRPLYYSYLPNRRFVFSSDLQSIAAHPGVSPTLDLPYTRAFLENEMFQHPTRTFIREVRKLPAAHFLVLDRNGLSIRRYWKPDSFNERMNVDDRECVEELRALLRQAVGSRMPPTGVDVGAHLSGGLDSSSIVAAAASVVGDRGRELKCFSWSPPRDVVAQVDLDERDLVDAVADVYGLRAHYTQVRPRDVADIGYRDLALRPRTTLNFEVVTSRNAVDVGVGTMLSGWGGDEAIAFNGRGYFADLVRRGRFATLQRELRLRSRIHGGSLLGAWKHRALWPLLPDRAVRDRASEPARLPAELRPEFAQLIASAEPLEEISNLRERPGVHRMQAALLEFGHLQYRMEGWAAHGAELGLTYAFPLLDQRLIEFALNLPGRMFFRDGWKRWLYRTAMDGILPDHVRWNPTKYDNAAVRHLQTVTREPAAIYRERLMERQDNPMIDVKLVLAEHDRRYRSPSSVEDSSTAVSYNPVSPVMWLAFTRLRPA